MFIYSLSKLNIVKHHDRNYWGKNGFQRAVIAVKDGNLLFSTPPRVTP